MLGRKSYKMILLWSFLWKFAGIAEEENVVFSSELKTKFPAYF